MDLIPAIDILDGSVVRLLRGDYASVTHYDSDPVAVAGVFVDHGATMIHVVDLDAARGRDRNVDALRALGDAGVPFQAGGGVRTSDDAAVTIAAGAQRVVIGSALTSGGGAADAIVEGIGAERVVAAIDVAQGRARGSGWLDAGAPLASVVARTVALGIGTALVTGIERDGTLAGPDTDVLASVAALAPDVDLLASGGVGDLDDLAVLADQALCSGVIVGRALYEGRFTVAEALNALGA